ncbi:solute carrier organic anion transporter family member 4A1-like, partial [Diaphorina citri]|uniref:Solute carrier organic anion transporter family member 4A1-like n=1 Tax=Diaphorina citri TaxID=121845 RepID=A0A3Q0JEV3_DIACI
IKYEGINVFYKCSCISMNKSNGFIIEKDRRTLNFYRQLIESSVMNKLRDKVSRMENDSIRDERVLDISQDDIEEMLDAIVGNLKAEEFEEALPATVTSPVTATSPVIATVTVKDLPATVTIKDPTTTVTVKDPQNPNLLKGSTDKNYLESNTDKNFLKPNTINNVLKPDNNVLEPNTDKISIRTFTFSLCLSSFLQGTLENGFVRLNLLSLEHKFGLATSQLAYILAGYDVATVLFLIPFVYFTGGPHTDKPRYIALGLLFMGAGSAVLALPQFLVPPEDLYSGDNDTDLCLSGIEPSTSPVPVPESSSGLVVAIFILGQTLVGIGATPLYTLAVTWIDENIPKRKSPLYVGFFYTASILGPAFGYIVGGFVLDNIHTDFLVHHSPLTINSSSKLWIGAWWLLFLAAGIVCLVIGGFLLLYPKNLTRTGPDELYNIQEIQDENKPVGTMIKSLMQNPIYVGLCLLSICEAFILSAFNSFMSP